MTLPSPPLQNLVVYETVQHVYVVGDEISDDGVVQHRLLKFERTEGAELAVDAVAHAFTPTELATILGCLDEGEHRAHLLLLIWQPPNAALPLL
jgi:hypothetical protein